MKISFDERKTKMKKFTALLSLLLLIAFTTNPIFACGPSYISPIFEYERAPEDPFENFAAGKIGIIKQTHRRIVLLAAYRYLNGGGFSAPEQKALVEVWNAEFNNKPYESDDIGEAVKKWVEKRKSALGKEEKTPEIYTEREYGGYDFFPNCTKNAFETAAETLSDRVASHGSEDRHVKDWIKAQDKVFENCASGKVTPEAPSEAMPEWLRKDRAYQLAAADFYSLAYDSAKQRFFEISQDYDSPWRETAEYLVGRTILRQASLSKNKTQSNLLYIEAEQNLSSVAAKGGKYADSAERLIGLIKYRFRPQERVGELGRIIASQGDSNFRQNLIDYNWLLDKFEKETLESEEKRLEEIKKTEEAANSAVSTNTNNAVSSNTDANNENEDKLSIYVYSDDYKENWTIYVKFDATDAEAIAEAERVVGRPLTEKMKEQVKFARKSAYTEKFEKALGGVYQGGYYGTQKMSLSILPDFLRADDLTNWLFAFQTEGAEAYLYALSEFRRTTSNLWLLTAMTKAGKTSAELASLLEAAEKVDRDSPAYPTIAYHQARIFIEQGKTPEARKLLDQILNSNLDMPVSSRNMFLLQRARLAESLDDYLKFAQLKPFAFDWGGRSGTIEGFIKEQKSWYSTENYPNQTREQYEREVEERFKAEKTWQERSMFDFATINVINQHFPLPVLMETEKSPALPEYLRERFALAIWTRAVLINDFATAGKISEKVVKYHPELLELMEKVNLAKTPVARQRAALYLILKNPMLTPFLEDGMGRTDNDYGNWDINDWWCEPYDTEFDDTTGETVKSKLPPKPLFLNAAQSADAQTERKKLAELGDAPTFFGAKTIEWARLAPADNRVPESLYIAWQSNGWRKYSCGNNEELRTQIAGVLKKKYPQSEWTQKLIKEESGEQ